MRCETLEIPLQLDTSFGAKTLAFRSSPTERGLVYSIGYEDVRFPASLGSNKLAIVKYS